MTFLPRLLSIVLAAVYGLAATGKILNFEYFSGVLAGYRLVPKALVRPSAVLLCLTEVLVAVGLFALPSSAVPGLAATALFSLFSVAIGINLARGNTRIECGCQGKGQTISWGLVSRNLLFASCALITVNLLRIAALFVMAALCSLVLNALAKRRVATGPLKEAAQ